MSAKLIVPSLFFSVLVMLSAPARAQDPTSQPSQDEVEQQNLALKTKAYRLLDQIIDESQSLRLPENRVRIQINAADLIWDSDQGRARSLFMQASDGVTELMRSTSNITNQRGQPPERRWFSLRQDLVLAAARHDAPLAYQLLAATKQQTPPATTPSSEGRNPRVLVNLDDNLEQTLLSRVAALDPKLAAQNAEQLMDKGQFPRTMGDVINQLRRQDSEAAAKLADKTVKRIQSTNLLTSMEAVSLAQTLLSPGPRIAPSSQTDSQNQTTQPRGPVLDQSSYIELLSTVIDSALKATPQQRNNQRGARGGSANRVVTVQSNNQPPDVQVEQNNARRLMAGLQAVLPSIDTYLPARANAVRQKLTELGATDSTRVNFGQTMNTLRQGNATSDALMQAAAATAPGPMQSRLYQQAAVRAVDEGNTDRARQIANDHLQAGPRASVIQRIDFRELAKKAEGAQLDEIRQNLARLSSESEKVSLLLQLAGDLQKDNPKAQLQLLEEAKQMISHRAANYDQFEDQLRVARAFATVDAARSFEVLEQGVSQLNELLSAASVLSGFEVNVFRDGEMMMTGQGGGLGSTINRFGQELAILAKTDFERSETLAGRFQFTEPRIMARMSIVQGALGVQSTNPVSPNIFRNIGGGIGRP